MNTTLLLSCTLALAQPASAPLASPEFAGTFSVLVKTTSLVGTTTLENDVVRPPNVLDAPPAASASEPVLTPVPPLGRPATAGHIATTSHVEEDAGLSFEASGLPDAAEMSEPISPTAKVLRELLATPQRGALQGNRLPLRDALAGTTDRHVQLQIVSAYWQLVAAVGRYHAALDRQDQFALLPEPDDAAQAVRLQAALLAAATASLRDAELSAVSMQYALADLLPSRSIAGPAFPVDPPFVGVYRTQFESWFVNRPAPGSLFRIHKILPLRLAAVDARALAVMSAEEAAGAADDSYTLGETSLEELLRQLAARQLQREAFLAAVRDYNIDIAAYALAVAGEHTDVDTLVSMLIGAAPRAGSLAVVPEGVTGQPLRNVVAGDAQAGPTLAAGPPPWQTSTTAAAHAAPVTATPVTATPVTATPVTATPVTATPVAASPATARPPNEPAAAVPATLSAEQSEATPFRDVTPSQPGAAEVLVPTPPARYRSVPLPPPPQATVIPPPNAGFPPAATGFNALMVPSR